MSDDSDLPCRSISAKSKRAQLQQPSATVPMPFKRTVIDIVATATATSAAAATETAATLAAPAIKTFRAMIYFPIKPKYIIQCGKQSQENSHSC